MVTITLADHQQQQNYVQMLQNANAVYQHKGQCSVRTQPSPC